MELLIQTGVLLLLAIPVACIAWTVTHEEIFREPREYCVEKSKSSPSIWQRKFFYLFTCEYCFSHYVTLFFIIVTGFQMIYSGWLGYLVSFFAVVWVANIYMSLFGLLRQGIKNEKITANIKEEVLSEVKDGDEVKLERIQKAVDKIK